MNITADTPCLAAIDAAGHCIKLEFQARGPNGIDYAKVWTAQGYLVAKVRYAEADASMRAGIAERAKNLEHVRANMLGGTFTRA